MIRTFLLLSAAAFAAPAAAQDHQHHDGHPVEAHDHADHQGGAHEGHDGEVTLGAAPEIASALAEGGHLVTVDVLGMVCDFCATALNRTFARRDEVAAVYVDLDDKTLSVVFHSGADLPDAEIEDLVSRAGYRIAAINRSGALQTGVEAAGSEPHAGHGQSDAPDDT